jgi:hypothetical protein
MNGLESLSIVWVLRVISVALLLQAIEMIMIRSVTREDGVWTWSVLKAEFAGFAAPLRWLLDYLFKYPNFNGVLCLQALVASVLIFYPSPAGAICLLVTATLVCLRWRGTFNGGSDFMTLVVLSALSAALVFHGAPDAEKVCLWYIAIQTCTSYFSAGLNKLKTANWRSGKALQGFYSSAIYQSQGRMDRWLRSERVVFLSSWLVIVFECSFPLALLNARFCTLYLCLSMGFHLANFYVFGLNRFLFAWMATYPALYYCSQRSIS